MDELIPFGFLLFLGAQIILPPWQRFQTLFCKKFFKDEYHASVCDICIAVVVSLIGLATYAATIGGVS